MPAIRSLGKSNAKTPGEKPGLTHGGFYAYFESREALMIEAFTTAMRCRERVRFIAE